MIALNALVVYIWTIEVLWHVQIYGVWCIFARFELCQPQMGPMLTPWTLLSGSICGKTVNKLKQCPGVEVCACYGIFMASILIYANYSFPSCIARYASAINLMRFVTTHTEESIPNAIFFMINKIDKAAVVLIPSGAELLWGNIKICLQFLSFLNAEMVYVGSWSLSLRKTRDLYILSLTKWSCWRVSWIHFYVCLSICLLTAWFPVHNLSFNVKLHMHIVFDT